MGLNHDSPRDHEADLLRLMLQNVRDFAIFSLDIDGRVSSWNPGAERMFGWPESEILGRDGEILFTPEDREAGVPRREQVVAMEAGRAEAERWHVRKDGSRFFAGGVLTPIIYERPHGYAKVCRDVTDRKTAEESLARDALILANVHDAVIVTDVAGVVTYWNEGASRLFGWTAGEMVGRHYADRFPEADRARIVDRMEANLEDGADWSGEYEDHRKDGSRVWIEASVARIDDASGRTTGVLSVSRDVTARMQAEA